jgi:hypothetical protein
LREDVGIHIRKALVEDKIETAMAHLSMALMPTIDTRVKKNRRQTLPMTI